MRVFVLAKDPDRVADEIRRKFGFNVVLEERMGLRLIVLDVPEESLREVLRELVRQMRELGIEGVGFSGIFEPDVLDRLKLVTKEKKVLPEDLIDVLLSGLIG